MNRENYIRLMDWGKASKRRVWWIRCINRYVTDVVYVAYPVLLIWLAIHWDERIWRSLLVPGVSYLLISIFRHFYDEKRPYVAFGYEPVIKKEKAGKSMPSRHVFSAMIIAVAFYYIEPLLSIPMFICAGVMVFGRVLAGVHYPKDVIVGTILGIGMGLLGFYII